MERSIPAEGVKKDRDSSRPLLAGVLLQQIETGRHLHKTSDAALREQRGVCRISPLSVLGQ
jgi:hypothetical protein